jgi:hypothetical protein
MRSEKKDRPPAIKNFEQSKHFKTMGRKLDPGAKVFQVKCTEKNFKHAYKLAVFSKGCPGCG